MKEKKILLVDDEEVIRDTFQQAFNKAGYMVCSVKNGEEALEILGDEDIKLRNTLCKIKRIRIQGEVSICQISKSEL